MKIEMKKQILSAIIAFIMIFTQSGVFAEDIPAVSSMIDNGIMNRYEDGSFGESDLVTRAQLAKIAVNASLFSKYVAGSISTSTFADVEYYHWAAPYIRVAATNGLIYGYSDSTFRPEENAAYEDATTVCLRLLGYSNDDFGSSWPYSQLGLADRLGITANVNASLGEALTRHQMAVMVYNTLHTKAKNSDRIYFYDYKQ